MPAVALPRLAALIEHVPEARIRVQTLLQVLKADVHHFQLETTHHDLGFRHPSLSLLDEVVLQEGVPSLLDRNFVILGQGSHGGPSQGVSGVLVQVVYLLELKFVGLIPHVEFDRPLQNEVHFVYCFPIVQDHFPSF